MREKKQKERLEQLTAFVKTYTYGSQEAAIVKLPLDKLVKKLQSRELAAKRVLEAYVARAVVINGEHHCITEFIPQSFVRNQFLLLPLIFFGVIHCYLFHRNGPKNWTP